MIVTYKFRLKDSTRRGKLRELAREVNMVWNFTNEIIRRRWRESRFYTDKSHINPLVRGASKELSINSQTVQAVAYECLLRTKKAKKNVRFRTSKNNKNLGWIPFNGQTFKFHSGYVDYNGIRLKLWEHRKIPAGAKIKTGSFSEDPRGRWYVNMAVEIPDAVYFRKSAPKNSAIGIDPGVKTQMTTSDGEKFERDNLTRKYAEKLAGAQRHGKKKLAKTVHAKIKNKRLDFAHKASEKLASEHDVIFFGDASSSRLKRTKMAKSVSDAGWALTKQFLVFKTIRRRGIMLEISEKYSTVTCSTCLERTGPSGLSGLTIREWLCGSCGTYHGCRDTNAAKNILRLGHETLNVAGKTAA